MGIPLDAVSCHPVMGHGRLAGVGDVAHHTAGIYRHGPGGMAAAERQILKAGHLNRHGYGKRKKHWKIRKKRFGFLALLGNGIRRKVTGKPGGQTLAIFYPSTHEFQNLINIKSINLI